MEIKTTPLREMKNVTRIGGQALSCNIEGKKGKWKCEDWVTKEKIKGRYDSVDMNGCFSSVNKKNEMLVLNSPKKEMWCWESKGITGETILDCHNDQEVIGYFKRLFPKKFGLKGSPMREMKIKWEEEEPR